MRIEAGVGIGDADEFGLRAVDRVAENPAAGRAVRIHAACRQYSHLPQALTQEIRTRSPGLKCGDARRQPVDDADALMAENAAGLAGRHVAFEDVQVGAANRRLGDLDDRVGGRSDLRVGRSSRAFFPGP